MTDEPMMPAAIAAAYEVVELWEENMMLRRELVRAAKYEKLYNDEVMAGIRHGEKMMGGLVSLLLNGQLVAMPSAT